MTIHRMNLQTKSYNYIKDGTKRLEARILDNKRQNIQLGDIIEFYNPKGEVIGAKVTGVLFYKTFKDLFDDFDVSVIADKSETKEVLIKELEKFHDKEKQLSFGVIGVRFEVLKKYPDVIDEPRRLL